MVRRPCHGTLRLRDVEETFLKPDHRFIQGLELFNRREFFECHEVIEDLWLETSSEDSYRDLYKGVIQAAAAIYQWQRGINSGANGLFKTSMVYLREYSPAALGLNVEKMLNDIRRFIGEKKEQAMPVLEFQK